MGGGEGAFSMELAKVKPDHTSAIKHSFNFQLKFAQFELPFRLINAKYKSYNDSLILDNQD